MNSKLLRISFWGCRCWYDTETNVLMGVNKFHSCMIPIACWFQDTMAMITQSFNPSWNNPGFRFKIIGKGKSNDLL